MNNGVVALCLVYGVSASSTYAKSPDDRPVNLLSAGSWVVRTQVRFNIDSKATTSVPSRRNLLHNYCLGILESLPLPVVKDEITSTRFRLTLEN
jgi:hypothetical protein